MHSSIGYIVQVVYLKNHAGGERFSCLTKRDPRALILFPVVNFSCFQRVHLIAVPFIYVVWLAGLTKEFRERKLAVWSECCLYTYD
jgi:hypothetical protein